MLSRRGRPPKSKKNSPIIDGAKFIKRFQPKLIYDQRGLLYQDLPIGCVRTLKGGRLYQEILREKNSQYYWGAEIIKVFFRGRTRRESMVVVNFSSNVTIDYRKWKIKPLSLWLTKCTLQGRVWLPSFGTMCWVIRCIQCHMTHGKVLYTVHHMILYNTSYSTVPY